MGSDPFSGGRLLQSKQDEHWMASVGWGTSNDTVRVESRGKMR